MARRSRRGDHLVVSCGFAAARRTNVHRSLAAVACAKTPKSSHVGPHFSGWFGSQCSIRVLADQSQVCSAGGSLRHGVSDWGIARATTVGECSQDASVSECSYRTVRRSTLHVSRLNGKRSTTRVWRTAPPVWPQAAHARRLQPGLRNVASRARIEARGLGQEQPRTASQ